ncbi:MAG: ThuA domain-containing protein [Armatimonadetes bacterium]|nr:ThuA domain-containing protein [Armatimonadota bacterium]
MSDGKLKVLVWDEKPAHAPKEIYPASINGAVAEGLVGLDSGKLEVLTANLEDPAQGIANLENTDVLVWWGHARHGEVSDETAARVVERVRHRGMGFVALHSAHYSKPFRGVLDAPGHLKGGWREDDQPEEIRVCAPRHPIAEGLFDFTLPAEEMYGAPFGVPPPSVLVFQSYFPAGGEYFPSGICWTVGEGKTPGSTSGPGGGVGEGVGIGRVFYFRPGHETIPTYFDPHVRRIIFNAVLWAGKLK